MPKIKNDSSIDSGEAVGIIAAQSLGEPGTQMSLPYDEKVIIKEDSEIKVVEIGAFIDEMMSRFGNISEKGHDICNLPIEVYTLSLGNDEKMRWCRIAALSRHNSPQKLIRITLSSGRKITATPFHSFIIRSENRIIPVCAKHLKKGERLPVMRGMPLAESRSLINVKQSLGNRIEQLTSSNGLLFAHPLESNKPFPNNLELDDEFGWFIGVYIAEGHSASNYLFIPNTDGVIREKVRSFALARGLTVNEYNTGDFTPSVDLRIDSTILTQFLRLSSGENSYTKRVPEFAYSASDGFVSALLRGYFDCNGSVSVERKVIKFSSISKDLIDGISILLLRFGIFATKSGGKKYHTLSISHKYAQRFLDKIGSNVEMKRSALEMLAAHKSKAGHDVMDVVPGISNVLSTVARKLSLPTRYVNNFNKRDEISRSTLIKYLNMFDILASEKGISLPELEPLRMAVESDVVWDKIVKIEYISPTNKFVYDFTVPGSETFTTFEGVVTHNTMRTFHYAGVAEQVPLGLPRLIELVDARREPSKAFTDIYLNKDDEKDYKKAEELAASIEYITVEDVCSIVENFSKKELRIKVDLKFAQANGITVKAITKKIRGLMGKAGEVKYKSNYIVVRLDTTYQKLRKLSMKIKAIPLKGIKGLSKATVIKDEKNGIYFVRCGGSNISELKKLEGIDYSRLYTNNVRDIEKYFGVEAARNALLKEIKQVMDLQGLPVDVRHLMLIADAMCARGSIEPVGRHGLSGRKSSVLARAAFEETVKHLVNASIKGEEDMLNGVTENIIIGQTIKLGTGKVRLAMRE